MFKKILKIIGFVLGGIVLLAGIFYAKVYFSIEKRLHTVYDVKPQAVAIRSDSATLALGGRLVKAKGCTDCHGSDLGGGVFIDDPALGFLVARNLTKGRGGFPADRTIDDWVLALKHGLNTQRTPLLFMPSHEYAHLSEHDMGAIIAYCEQLPKVDRELPESSVGPLGKILADLDKLPLFPAEMIDHNSVLIKEMKPEVTVEFGKYLSTACQGCHRENMKGGEPVAPGFPVVADISSTGNPGRWTDEQFITTLRTGVTPEGKTLKQSEMPWAMTKAFTDVELKALHLYLKQL
ncbi:MAG TPA: cytochrome c [Ohtaekwangia sp.]|nr:cytochrome c [Ohtaekwangia sp.]